MAKRKIAVLGSGVGAMSSVLELTSVPGWQDRFEIAVYQMGWRLGGKGASGRDQACRDRIYEHGLHLWMGFYENAFRQMRDAYAEWNEKRYQPAAPFATYLDAFSPRNYAPAMDQVDGAWTAWLLDFPPNPMEPGEDLPPRDQPFTFWDLTLQTLGRLLEAYLGVRWQKGWRGWILRCLGRLALWMADHLKAHPCLAKVLDWLVEHSPFPEFHLPLAYAHAHAGHDDPARRKALVGLLQDFIEWFGGQKATKAEHKEGMRRFRVLLDTAVPLIRGIVDDEVVEKGYDRLDNEDFLEWLTRHGSTEPNNAITRYFYDACFAYRQGRNEYHPEQPGPERMGLNMGAGAVLYGMLRLVGSYKGGLMYTMAAGMGDTIFSPFYVVLKNRGVRFEFFHKVLNLGLSPDKASIDAIDMEVQARVKGSLAYQPIFDVKGVPSWPSEPFWDQLENGEQLKQRPSFETYWDGGVSGETKTLTRGTDFDVVLLGISIGALPVICKELVEYSPKWRAMVDGVQTVKTQAMQLWLHKTMAEVGWPHPAPILTGFVEPHDTWCDLTHLLNRESWTPADDIQQLAYLCNAMQECQMAQCSASCLPHRRIAGCPMSPPFTETRFPAEQKALVKLNSETFLRDSVRTLWPNYEQSMLFGGSLDSQFWRVNVDLTERYVQNIAGSTRHRLRPDEAGFENLVMAGDWTYTPINIGCVEAAVMSGKMASWAICGKPDFLYGPMGYPVKMADVIAASAGRYKPGPA